MKVPTRIKESKYNLTGLDMDEWTGKDGDCYLRYYPLNLGKSQYKSLMYRVYPGH